MLSNFIPEQQNPSVPQNTDEHLPGLCPHPAQHSFGSKSSSERTHFQIGNFVKFETWLWRFTLTLGGSKPYGFFRGEKNKEKSFVSTMIQGLRWIWCINWKISIENIYIFSRRSWLLREAPKYAVLTTRGKIFKMFYRSEMRIHIWKLNCK